MKIGQSDFFLMAENSNAEAMSAEENVSLFLHRLHEAIAGNKNTWMPTVVNGRQ